MYALVADRADKFRFVVDDRGSTKTYSPEKWECVRRIRALTRNKVMHIVLSKANLVKNGVRVLVGEV